MSIASNYKKKIIIIIILPLELFKMSVIMTFFFGYIRKSHVIASYIGV